MVNVDDILANVKDANKKSDTDIAWFWDNSKKVGTILGLIWSNMTNPIFKLFQTKTPPTQETAANVSNVSNSFTGIVP